MSRPTSFVERSSPYRDSYKTLGDEEPGWRDHVKNTYATLKAEDPTTKFKKAMTHAKASYKSKK